MNKFWLILLVKSVCLLGFELRTFDEGPHQQLAHQTREARDVIVVAVEPTHWKNRKHTIRGGLHVRRSEHVSHALVPWAADETSEAVEARALWRTADTPTLEFVHIHKCGGQTFNVVAPELLCAQRWKSNASVHCSRCAGGSGPGGSAESILQQWSTKWGKCGGPCCVVRPDPSNSLPALLKKMPIKPRFVSDRGEFDAHVIPWAQNTHTQEKRRPQFQPLLCRVSCVRVCSDLERRVPGPARDVQGSHGAAAVRALDLRDHVRVPRPRRQHAAARRRRVPGDGRAAQRARASQLVRVSTTKARDVRFGRWGFESETECARLSRVCYDPSVL